MGHIGRLGCMLSQEGGNPRSQPKTNTRDMRLRISKNLLILSTMHVAESFSVCTNSRLEGSPHEQIFSFFRELTEMSAPDTAVGCKTESGVRQQSINNASARYGKRNGRQLNRNNMPVLNEWFCCKYIYMRNIRSHSLKSTDIKLEAKKLCCLPAFSRFKARHDLY